MAEIHFHTSYRQAQDLLHLSGISDCSRTYGVLYACLNPMGRSSCLKGRTASGDLIFPPGCGCQGLRFVEILNLPLQIHVIITSVLF
jgi:hypothetical protein